MRNFSNAQQFADAVGEVLGSSDWVVVEQDRINLFADATNDHQWIHVEPRLAAAGPYGGTIAHGYLTLSLVPLFLSQIFRVDGAAMAINYGLNKVRFPAPVPVGSKLRGTAQLTDVRVQDGFVQSTVSTTVEVEGSGKPACVVESLGRYYF
ncbi:MaoC family dehydratase [Nocardia huaxiensis]|uniref:MaoC family dehydratase n=1 Tax=Nocardia huaxiensis TaxID=2755382 RepID=UPI001E2FAC3B|nr:MaoC family dehydratase [Nocardia huaxiensis]UFS98519.1 MaoC family dehydratase [Nocardia huaxiensis]